MKIEPGCYYKTRDRNIVFINYRSGVSHIYPFEGYLIEYPKGFFITWAENGSYLVDQSHPLDLAEEITPMLDLTKDYQTEEGYNVKIIKRVEPNEIVGEIFTHNGRLACIIDEKGVARTRYNNYVVHEKPKTIVRYFNIYPAGISGFPKRSREEADSETCPGRIGCQRVELMPGTWDD